MNTLALLQAAAQAAPMEHLSRPESGMAWFLSTVVKMLITFTNLRGRVQRFLQAKAAPGLARPSWFVLSDLLASLGQATDYFVPADVFTALASSHSKFAGLSYDTIGLRGLPVLGAAQAAGAAP